MLNDPFARRSDVYHALVLWTVFFCICLGLGYGSLNRFDPRTIEGTGDTADYAAMAAGAAPAHPGSHRSYRILIPLVARPFAQMARGRVGSWKADFAGLLVSTSLFTATTMLVIALLAPAVGRSGLHGLIAAFCFVTNFWVANHYLVGMVDSAEACAVVFMYFALTTRREWLLLVAGVVGGLGKETFVVLGSVGALVYWLVATRSERRWRTLGAIIAMGVLGLLAHVGARWLVDGSVFGSFAEVASVYSVSSVAPQFVSSLVSGQFWYGFVWLLPLAAPSFRVIPRPLGLASVAAAVAGLILVFGTYANAGPGNAARLVFTYVGPVLSLAAATTLVRLASQQGRLTDPSPDGQPQE